jgi:hypothetical protein
LGTPWNESPRMSHKEQKPGTKNRKTIHSRPSPRRPPTRNYVCRSVLRKPLSSTPIGHHRLSCSYHWIGRGAACTRQTWPSSCRPGRFEGRYSRPQPGTMCLWVLTKPPNSCLKASFTLRPLWLNSYMPRIVVYAGCRLISGVQKLHQPWPILSFHSVTTIPADLQPSQGP